MRQKQFTSKLRFVAVLLFAISSFISIGLYHLGQFETSDEHLWKNMRIPLYWEGISQGLKTGNWEKTYINDKPGVSLALISGIGLPFVPDPTQQRLLGTEKKYGGLFKIYDVSQTEHLNFALRLPLLLFNGLVMLPLLFFLVYRATDNKKIADFFILFIGLNPILIGISQIMNPDALLWSFGAGGVFSFMALLKTKERKFIWLTGLLTGFALLSKYTANLLFLFYGLMAFIYWLYTPKINRQYWKNFLRNYFFIILISWTVFALFVPAVIQTPDFFSWKKPKHFAYGTYLSPALKPIIKPLILALFVLILDSFILKNSLLLFLRKQFRRYRFWLLRLTALILLSLFLFVIFNALSGAKQIPLDDLKEKIGSTKKLHFYFTQGNPLLISYAKQISVESFNFIFSLPALNIFLLFFLWIFALVKPKKLPYSSEIIFFSLVPFIFFGGGLLAKVFVNVRYSILLYPFFSLLSAIALYLLIKQLSLKKIASKKILTVGAVLIIIVYQSIILFSIKPFFFNFQNVFLPKKYVLTDSWSYGIYEAAAKLNSLPNAKELQVWSDRGSFCRYFIGHCIKNRRIDRSKIKPDFFVITRRNVARGRFFAWKKVTEQLANHPASYYYQGAVFQKPWWEIKIDNRPKNYIKIIKADEK